MKWIELVRSDKPGMIRTSVRIYKLFMAVESESMQSNAWYHGEKWVWFQRRQSGWQLRVLWFVVGWKY